MGKDSRKDYDEKALATFSRFLLDLEETWKTPVVATIIIENGNMALVRAERKSFSNISSCLEDDIESFGISLPGAGYIG
ncbi:MAG: hypothetical protein V1735_06310 [Nanoarchaeota archaeon]